MTHPTASSFSSLIAKAISRPDLKAQMRAAIEVYRADPWNQANTDKLLALTPQIEAIEAPLNEALSDAIAQALRSAFDDGRAKDLGQDAPAAPFCDRWNGVAREGWTKVSPFMHEQLVEALQKALAPHLRNTARKTGDADAAAEQACAFIATGTIETITGGSDMFTNFADGISLDIEMTDWQPKLTYADADGKRRPPNKMPNNTVFHQKVKFPSGKLLVADSVRVGDIPDWTQKWTNENGISLNYALHRILRSSHMASEMGVIDISVGSDGPGLARDTKTGNLFAGRPDASDSRFEDVASICHDYWATTIIDRQLVHARLVDQGHSPCEADQHIDCWIDQSVHHSEVTVAPGTWHLYWDDDRETLTEMLRGGGVIAPDDTRFALTQKPLDIADLRLRSLAVQ